MLVLTMVVLIVMGLTTPRPWHNQAPMITTTRSKAQIPKPSPFEASP